MINKRELKNNPEWSKPQKFKQLKFLFKIKVEKSNFLILLKY